MRRLHALLVIAPLALAGLTGCGTRDRAIPPAGSHTTRPAVTTPATPARNTTTAPGSRPDLSIKVVADGCQAEPVSGQPNLLRVHYSYEVGWTRNPAFRSFTVRTTGVDGSARDTAQELPRPTGESVRTKTVVDVGSDRLGRDVQLGFVVDPANEIAEGDERNNAATLVLTLPADLPRGGGLSPLRCAAR